MAILALVPSAAQSEAVAKPDAAMAKLSDLPKTDVAKPSLPPRALLQIGTDDLRTTSHITAFAFSPDSRLVAAAVVGSPRPQVAIFDVRTGRRVKQLVAPGNLIVAPGNQRGWVVSVTFSPDGTKLLWGETNGAVALWELSGDRLLFREKLHGRAVDDVAFSPQGSVMASAGGDVIRVRRVAKPTQVVRDFTTRPGGLVAPKVAEVRIDVGKDIGCLAFTPDGTRLVAGTSAGATIFIWQIRDGQLLRKIPGAHGEFGSEQSDNSRLNRVAVTPDGCRIMSVGHTTMPIEQTKLKYEFKNVTMSEVRFWNIETGKLIADYHGDQDYGHGYGALSRDGRRVAVADFSRLRILDAATGREERTFIVPGSWGLRPAFSRDRTLVAMPIDNTIGLFEVSTGRRLHHDVTTPIGYVVSAAWSPSGERLVIGHRDGFVRVWDTGTGRLIWHKLLAPVISRDGWIAYPAFVSFSHDGKLVVAAGQRNDPVKHDNGIVAIYEAATGRTVREVPQKEIRWAALAPDGRMVVVATSRGGRGGNDFIGVEVATGRTRWANPPVDQPAGFRPPVVMQFEGDSPWFEAALNDGNVIRFNSLTGCEQRRFLAEWRTPEEQKAGRPRKPDMWEATFSADGRTLISSVKECLYIWDVESGTIRPKIWGPHQQSYHLALAPDGRTLATSDFRYIDSPGKDAIRLFDIETGKQVLKLEPGDGRPSVMVFSPDGTRLFTGFIRGSGIVWDVRRGEETPKAKE